MPNELLPEDHWGNYRSDEEIARNMGKTTQEALFHKQLANDNKSRFLRSTKINQAIPFKKPTVQLNSARKRHPNKRFKNKLDCLYEMLAPGSVVQKTDQHTAIREPGKLEVNVQNSVIAQFGTRDERKTKLSEYINRRGHRSSEKLNEAKILSHVKELTRIQKGDSKMKHRKRDTASGITPNRSNNAIAMRVRLPKLQSIFAPSETAFLSASTSAP